MKVISVAEAREQGLIRYYTGKPCKHNHIDERLTSDRSCCACNREAQKTWAKKNPEKKAAKDKKYQMQNLDKFNTRTKKWRDANPGKERDRVAKRRAAKISRTPTWLNAGQLFEIQCIYKYCASLRSIGLNFVVDHIEPLRGNEVSGLHVPWNMRVITFTENARKSNRRINNA